jgi:hypothetical protein
MEIKDFSVSEGMSLYSSKFTYQKEWVEIVPDKYPFAHPIRIKTCLVFSRKENGEHKTQIRLVDELRTKIIESTISTFTTEVPPEKNIVEKESVIEFISAEFPHAGTYSMILNVDGKDTETRSIIVREL